MPLTVPEAAERLGRSPETIRRWIRSGKLPARKIGTQHVIEEADLTASAARASNLRERAPAYGGGPAVDVELDDLLRRISIDPAVIVGQPAIKGTRISVVSILEWLAAGTTEDDLLEDYPSITLDDIRACLAYAAYVLQAERTYTLPS